MACQSRVKVSQYAVALIVAPEGMKSTRRMPFLSHKTDIMIFFNENEVLNFLVLGECVWRHWGGGYGAIAVTVAWIQECGEKLMFHLQSQWSLNTHLLPVRNMRNFSAEPICFFL
jgi:hypothetical protein